MPWHCRGRGARSRAAGGQGRGGCVPVPCRGLPSVHEHVGGGKLGPGVLSTTVRCSVSGGTAHGHRSAQTTPSLRTNGSCFSYLPNQTPVYTIEMETWKLGSPDTPAPLHHGADPAVDSSGLPTSVSLRTVSPRAVALCYQWPRANRSERHTWLASRSEGAALSGCVRSARAPAGAPSPAPSPSR